MIQTQAATRTCPVEPRIQESQWNQLWNRSGSALPLARDECQRVFARTFSTEPLTQLKVSRQGQCVAGLALVKSNVKRMLPAYVSPNNPWFQTGFLLVADPSNMSEDLRCLAEQVAQLRTPLVVLDWHYETAAMRCFLNHLQQRKVAVRRQPQFLTGIIDVQGSWDAYLSGRTAGFRKKLRARSRRLAQVGEVSFERWAHPHVATTWHELLDHALAIEHAGWKGQQGTSLNSHPTIRQTFMNLLAPLAQRGLLEVQFLTVGGRRIAFEIGLRSHRTYYSYKVGYDPDFASYSPGQLLMRMQLQHWFSSDLVDQVDTVGDLNAATGKWCTRYRQRYRYTLGTRRWSAGGMHLSAYCRPMIRRWGRHQNTAPQSNVT